MQTTITAPRLDNRLHAFRREYKNPSKPSTEVTNAIELLLHALQDLAPTAKREEVKRIWLIVPRGTIQDFGTFEEFQDCGMVETEEEMEELWKEEYPDENVWYELVVSEERDKDGNLQFCGVSCGDKYIVSAAFDDSRFQQEISFTDEITTELLTLLAEQVGNSMDMLRNGTYNEYVHANLPYQHRTGVVKRSDVWKAIPEAKDDVFYQDWEKKIRIPEDTLETFRMLVSTGANDPKRITRMERFTANDFFRACAIGYKACEYKGTELPPEEQYLLHADGRDEGLTGKGDGLHAGSGIDFDDPDAWDAWYNDKNRFGGHPWEVCRGGNSTHVSLMVANDENSLNYKVRAGLLTQEEADKYPKGYYFVVAGKSWSRAVEAVRFYVAIHEAGMPVVLSDAEAILRRFDGTDLIGIVPHDVIPRYCESMFPGRFGTILDFTHVYDEDLEAFGDSIIWLDEEEARLVPKD